MRVCDLCLAHPPSPLPTKHPPPNHQHHKTQAYSDMHDALRKAQALRSSHEYMGREFALGCFYRVAMFGRGIESRVSEWVGGWVRKGGVGGWRRHRAMSCSSLQHATSHPHQYTET
jgi:hypothetical protein